MIRFSAPESYVTLHGTDMCAVSGFTYQLGQVTGNDYIMGEFRPEISTGRYRLKNPQVIIPLWGVYSGDKAGTGTPVKVKAALEFGTAYIPLKFGGNDTIDGVTGENVTADALGIDIPENTVFRCRMALQVPDVDSWFYDGVGGGGRFSNRTISQSETYGVGAFVQSGNGLLSYGMTPIAIKGQMLNGKSVGIYGDSILAGSGSFTGRDNGFARVGLRNAAAGVIPSVNYARSFEYLQTFVGSGGAKRRALTSLHSHMIVMFGTNDLGGSFSFNTMRNWFLTCFSALKAEGQHVTVCTILPRTSGNVVVDPDYAAGGVRDQLNAWFYTQVGNTIDEVLDTASAIENPSDHTLWNLDYTGDETHPNNTGRAVLGELVTEWADRHF